MESRSALGFTKLFPPSRNALQNAIFNYQEKVEQKHTFARNVYSLPRAECTWLEVAKGDSEGQYVSAKPLRSIPRLLKPSQKHPEQERFSAPCLQTNETFLATPNVTLLEIPLNTALEHQLKKPTLSYKTSTRQAELFCTVQYRIRDS